MQSKLPSFLKSYTISKPYPFMPLFFSYACYKKGYFLLSGPTNSPGSLAPLYMHRLRGGLGVPNIAKYDLAVQISQPTLLHAILDIALWLLLQLPNCTPIPEWAPLCLLHRVHSPVLGPLMLHSLKLWDSVRYSGNLVPPFLPVLPLFNNPLFLQCSKQPESFSWWLSHGFMKVRHLLMFLLLGLVPGNSRGTTHCVFSLRPTTPLGDLSEMQFYLPLSKKGL